MSPFFFFFVAVDVVVFFLFFMTKILKKKGKELVVPYLGRISDWVNSFRK